jgi:uncharacterized protein YbjT (DUF2867 family)
MKETIMKIVVIGGSGLIGSKLVNKLREHGHEAVAASPNSGVNTLTGEGLAEVLKSASVDGNKVRLPPVLFQPMAADDVASAVGRIAVGQPVNGIVEIGGPEQFRMDELVRRRLASLKDPREVIADPNARYSGAKISEKTLLPGNNARLGETTFETWLTQSAGTGLAA